jgi:hypothetical protein
MYLSAEPLAVANKAVQETFEETSVAWQAIPHWDTGDPGQTKVRSDVTKPPGHGPFGGDSLYLRRKAVRFYVTLAQACAPTPDALLAAVMKRTVELAAEVDEAVLEDLREEAKPVSADPKKVKIAGILDALIDARAKVEDKGYRAPACLLTNTAGIKALSQLVGGYSVAQSVLDAANINSLHRAKQLDYDDKNKQDDYIRMIVLGRRQRIAHGCAAAASPGEEPVDLAVSVPPSMEVVGETANGYIELAVRIRFAARIKDENGVVGVKIHEES